MPYKTHFDTMSSVQDLVLGFVGCGKISSALVRGYASLGEGRPQKVLVSQRNVEKSTALLQSFPDLVEVREDNQSIVRDCDVVFIGLLPGVARAELPTLPFRASQLIVSMMAAVDFAELKTLIQLDSHDNVVRTVPLPSAARRTGPILLFPRHHQIVEVLSCVGTPVPCENEAQMKPMVAVTGHISSFYELQRTTADFLSASGVAPDLARTFVTAFYMSLSQGAFLSHESLADLRDEAATPGGLNEQSVHFLTSSPHFSLQDESLQQILARLRK